MVISGAGPTGLMLALWLARKGVRALVLDKGEGLTQESRALGVQARSLETYDMLGIGEEAIAKGRPALGVAFWGSGKARWKLQFQNMGEGISPHPYLFVLSQDENEKIMYDALRQAGGEVHWNCRVLGFEQDSEEVRTRIDTPEGEEVVVSRYLCGCDGVSSPVRKDLLGDFPGGTYRGLFFVADVKLEKEFEYINIHLSGGGVLLLFPMVGDRRVRLIGTVPDEALEDGELPPEVVDRRAREIFHAGVEESYWISTYKVHHRVARRFRENRVFLLGDAAHVHSPAGGQGMNTGLLDAANLGWKLAAVLQDGADPYILESYEAERLPFARKLVKTTDTFFQFVAQGAFWRRLMRAVVLPVFLTLASRFRFIRRFMFRTISQTNIDYRHSPLSDSGDLPGQVLPGDRLPWVPHKGGDNFEALQSCDWQIHVYGDAGGIPEEFDRVPVHRFDYSDRAARRGLVSDAVYLIRPDGYVGMVQQTFERDSLEEYLRRFRRF